jgi:NADH-quinone oxidoreductase subunit F
VTAGDGSAPRTEPVSVLTSRWGDQRAHEIDRYLELDGYASLDAAFGADPAELVQMVKDSGLRGRGGAGFPTGMKWGFLAKGTGKPTYLVVNADESEPGTFKDMELVERDPHALVEGTIVSAYAIGCNQAFIYLRGECGFAGRRLAAALGQAYERGLLGRDIKGSGFDLDVVLHRGAGAYICGEETALLSSLEGERGQPKLRPPFPAVEGLYRAPTTVNNVETIATVPWIYRKGVDWFRSMGTEKSPGPKLFSVSGEVRRPGNYEYPLGTPARELIDGAAGGMLEGKALKAWTPGGSSTPMLTPDHLDTPMDFESIQGAGSLLGTAAMIVLSEDVCIVDACLNFTKFYAHESCGKCTPCREGTDWMAKILTRLETGAGRKEDMDTLKDICDSIFGRSFCALGDGATSPIVSALKFFRDEFERHVGEGGCPFGASQSLQGSVAPLHGMDEEAEQASPSSSRQGAQ